MRIKLIFTLAALFFKSIHCCAHTHLEVKSKMSSTCRFKIWQRILLTKKNVAYLLLLWVYLINMSFLNF